MSNPGHWFPPAELTARQQKLLARASKKRAFFGILYDAAAELLDESFQDELLGMYRDTGAGLPPIPPAQMLMLLLLQKSAGVADHEAVNASSDDLRWRLLLGRWDHDDPLCAQSTLYDFRMRLLATGMDRRVLERSIELFRSRGKRIPTDLKLALDSAPLTGRGKVEDTINLLAHASRKVISIMARLGGLSIAEFAQRSGLEFFTASSPKAAIDMDWSRPEARQLALDELLEQLESLEQWITDHMLEESSRPPLAPALERLRGFLEQDLEPDPDGARMSLVQGVAKDRQISVSDEQMRHGRKSVTQRIDGYKRHIARELVDGLVLAAQVAPANERDEARTAPLLEDVQAQGVPVSELHVDRGYLGEEVGGLDEQGVLVVCRGMRLSNQGRYTKHDFDIDLEAQRVMCPAGEVAQIKGSRARFDKAICLACAQRERCTKAAGGRCIQLHANERMHQSFEALSKTTHGRSKLRERSRVEHGLSHLVRRQGTRARYNGARKNTLDARLCSAVFNLHRLSAA